MIILKLALAASLTSVQGGYNRIPPESPYQITIYSTTDLDDTNDLWGPFEISTHVVSPHGIAGVFLYHLEDGDSTFKIEEMSHVQDDLYVTSIEGPGRGGGVIQYFIHAVDSSFSVKRDPENAPLDTYESQIFYIPDFFSPDSVMGIESLYPGSRFSHQWEDLDGDADIDLYIALPSPRESNIFYRNEDGKNYTDITDISGLSLPDLMSVGIASGDYDNDGYCDLAVIASISNPILFHNGSDGIFEDVSEAAGFTEGLIEPTDFLWVDADVDGYIDLLVVAEDGVFLYMNNDGVYFQNEAAVRGLPYNDTNCVGVLAFDADADGDSEILLLGHESMFFENEAGHFVDMTSHSGLGGSERGGLILDADSDCDMDLLLYDETMKVFLNNGSGSFTDMSSDYGVTMMGSKPVADDLNNDGLPD
ncbi:MAG: FG-GAP repeat domain-containing protein, partial [Candidatus Glassbacteria bacterium]